MEKLWAILNLFRQGSAVANPDAWHQGHISVAVLAGLLLSVGRVAEAFGHPLPIDQPTADSIAGGVLAVTGLLVPTVTSKAVGLPAEAGTISGGDAKPVGNSQPAPASEPPAVTNL